MPIPSSGKVLTGGVDVNAYKDQKMVQQETLRRRFFNNYFNSINRHWEQNG